MSSSSPSLVAAGDMQATVPNDVRRSFVLWLVVIGLGVFEIILGAVDTLTDSGSNGTVDQLITGVAGPSLFLVIMVRMVYEMRRGNSFGRVALAVMLCVLGTIFLVFGPMQWLAGDNSFSQLLENATATESLVFAGRMGRFLIAIAAAVLMYRPAANIYYRTTKNVSSR